MIYAVICLTLTAFLNSQNETASENPRQIYRITLILRRITWLGASSSSFHMLLRRSSRSLTIGTGLNGRIGVVVTYMASSGCLAHLPHLPVLRLLGLN